jgi:hypothetical protein
MSVAEIIAELPRLTATELAEVLAKMHDLVEPDSEISKPPRIYSPRLAHPEQSKDFTKTVLQPVPNAKL